MKTILNSTIIQLLYITPTNISNPAHDKVYSIQYYAYMWTFPREHFYPDFEGPFRQLSKSSAREKKSSTKKSWPTFCDQYFWKFPILNSRAEEKRWEIQMVKVNVIFNDIRLLICLTPFGFTGKLGHGD